MSDANANSCNCGIARFRTPLQLKQTLGVNAPCFVTLMHPHGTDRNEAST
jgi:hypothetical protein